MEKRRLKIELGKAYLFRCFKPLSRQSHYRLRILDMKGHYYIVENIDSSSKHKMYIPEFYMDYEPESEIQLEEPAGEQQELTAKEVYKQISSHISYLIEGQVSMNLIERYAKQEVDKSTSRLRGILQGIINAHCEFEPGVTLVKMHEAIREAREYLNSLKSNNHERTN